jgi:CrcB protein
VTARHAEAARPGTTVALVALGGAGGAALRYQLGQWFPVAGGTFPTTTFAINVSGAFALGVLYAWLARHRPDDRWRRALVGIGFMGAFTTFSTLCTETVLLVRDDASGVALAYVVASLAAGVVAAVVGVRLGGAAPRAALPSGES